MCLRQKCRFYLSSFWKYSCKLGSIHIIDLHFISIYRPIVRLIHFLSVQLYSINRNLNCSHNAFFFPQVRYKELRFLCEFICTCIGHPSPFVGILDDDDIQIIAQIHVDWLKIWVTNFFLIDFRYDLVI